MAEVIVDRLQPVEVEVQDRDGSGACPPRAFRTDARPAPDGCTGRSDRRARPDSEAFPRPRSGPELREQGGDGLERVDLFLLPLPGAELDEAEHAGGHLARDQRGGGHRGRGGRLGPPIQRWSARLACSGRITTGFLPCSHWASTGSALVKWTTAIGSGPERRCAAATPRPVPRPECRGRGGARNWRPDRTARRAARVPFSLTRVAVDAVASISWVATEVTTRSRLRGTGSSDMGHMSQLGWALSGATPVR